MFERFKQLNGDHPWRDVGDHGYIDYEARTREGGRVIYFNYALAAELDLIPRNHARKMTAALEKTILDTFALQIVNEYDLAHPESFDASTVRPHRYMATRYLQLQHKDRMGKTSGDGRAIWNGTIKASRMTFDVSSRGTGATCLSPGAQVASEPVQTGDDSHGYSCGRADLDEMIGTALMSEIFYQNGLPTERTLAVIDFGDGTAIGVRTAPNLIRPAHIFRYVKQGRHDALKASLDYFTDRQEANGVWKLPSKKSPARRYRKALEHIARSYGRLSAILEEEYIFNWLAWDGDNMLACGAILDYGSVRQFGAKHDRYRYDDVDRWSTSLTEQRFWARELVRVFAQAFHFVRTGKKAGLQNFKNAACLVEFDREFERERDRRLLWRVGFTTRQIKRLLKTAGTEIRDLRRALGFFEDQKVARGIEKVSDGVTHRPVFLIRNLLRQLPEFYLHNEQPDALMPPEQFCGIMAASYASRRDMKLTAARMARAENFQKCYQRLIARAGDYQRVLRTIVKRCAVINHPHRMTGNALIWIVEEVIQMKDKLHRNELQSAMDAFIESQVLIPGRWKPIAPEELEGPSLKSRLLRAIQHDLDRCKETV